MAAAVIAEDGGEPYQKRPWTEGANSRTGAKAPGSCGTIRMIGGETVRVA
jgi:hypothetical protein